MPMRFALSGLLLALLACSPALAGPSSAPGASEAKAPASGSSLAIPTPANQPAAAPVVPVAGTPIAAGSGSSAPAAAPSTDAQRFCQNVAAAAADARFALQTRKLNELEGQITKRIADLEAKEASVREVLAKHDEAMKRAAATLVGIYAKMRPDAAAQQISALDDATAAAVLSGLGARQSSAILNEITPDRAVKLVNTISGLVPQDGKRS